MAAPMDTITIENVVASTAVGQELDLEALSGDLEQAEYNPERFPGVIYRMTEPQATMLVFRSGEVVVTGANSAAVANEALGKLFEALGTLGIDVPNEPSTTVQNIVSSADLGNSLNLNAIAIALGLERIEYEPEQFPGLVYRLEEPSVVALLFGSGKVIITGATRTPDIERAAEHPHAHLDGHGLLD